MNCASAFTARAVSLPQAKSRYPKFDDQIVTVIDLYEIFTWPAKLTAGKKTQSGAQLWRGQSSKKNQAMAWLA